MDEPTEPAIDPAPAIDYAPPHVRDGGEAFVADPVAEAMIDRDAPFDEIAAHIVWPDFAADYVARSIARRFSRDVAGDGCVACGRPAEGVLAARWRLEGGAGLEVATVHPICAACDARQRAAADRAALTGQLGVALVAAAALALAVARSSAFVAIAAASLPFGVAAMLAGRRQRRRAVPLALRGNIPSMLTFAGWSAGAR